MNEYQELNRNGKYQTVVRLFNKHELALSMNTTSKYYDKAKQQADYARDNIESIRRSATGERAGESGKEGYSGIVLKRLFDFVKKMLFVIGGFFIFTMVFKNVIILQAKISTLVR